MDFSLNDALNRQNSLHEQIRDERQQLKRDRARSRSLMWGLIVATFRLWLAAMAWASAHAFRIIRAFGDAYVWRVGVVLISASIAVGIGAIFGSFFQRSLPAIGVGMFMFLLLALPLLVALAIASNESVIAFAKQMLHRLGQAEVSRRSLVDEYRDNRQAVSSLQKSIRSLQVELRQLKSFLGARQTQLCNTSWRLLRAYDFEQFLEQVFVANGYQVQRVGGSGDQGVDLIVLDQSRRIAVQAKGYEGAVSNTAVQEVFAGAQHHTCVKAVAITNSRFTQGARELAHSTGVMLIDESSMLQFIAGRLRV